MKECFRTTLICTLLFVILQVTAIGGTLVSWSKNHKSTSYDPEYQMQVHVLKLVLVLFNSIASVAYVGILIIFMGHMRTTSRQIELNEDKDDETYEAIQENI